MRCRQLVAKTLLGARDIGFACGRLVARAVLGDPDPLLEAFEPGRLLTPGEASLAPTG